MDKEYIENLVNQIYFETISCPEKNSEEYLKGKIRECLSLAAIDSLNDCLVAINEPVNQWNKSGSLNDNTGVVDKLIHMLQNMMIDKIINIKRDIENC